MKPATVSRIVSDRFREGPRQACLDAMKTLEPVAELARPSRWWFARYVASDHARFYFRTVRPIRGETHERARAAVEWLLHAQDATPDRGVSYGYFPCAGNGRDGWLPSYPETTGYIIPTLLAFAERYHDDEVRRRALEMAAWETEVQMPSGAVQGGPLCAPGEQVAAAFNTGMVLHGYTAAYRVCGDPELLDAGRRAAGFLLADQDADGHFRSYGPFVTPNAIHTYCCLCGWALYRFGEDTGEDRFKSAAVAAVEAAIRQQRPNGWFANNCIGNADAPLLHTICYTLQGLLEVGVLSGREALVDAAQRGTDPIVARTSRHGFVPGSFYADWEPAAFSACLTGSAQLAVVCYRLYEQTGEDRYRATADRIVNYLKALQVVDGPNPAINGALPGSFPMMGRYMTAGYPNWATKYFLDALMLQEAHQ